MINEIRRRKATINFFTGIMDYDNETTQTNSLKMGWKRYGNIGIRILAVIGTTDENSNQLKF